VSVAAAADHVPEVRKVVDLRTPECHAFKIKVS
jgi:hypothetical protein